MNRRNAVFLAVGTVIFAVLLYACGTIIHGTSQDVGISSSPTGATVTIDNERRGETPLVANLRRKDNHVIRIEMEGYEPYETTVTRKVSGWVWGNIVFGGLIGLAVDAISGGLYKLEPPQVEGQLARREANLEPLDDNLYIFVVLRPDPSWERIGALERAEAFR